MTDNELNVMHKLQLFPEMEVVWAKKKPKCYKMTNAGYNIGGIDQCDRFKFGLAS